MSADFLHARSPHSTGGRIAFAAAWCGTGALICALLPFLRSVAVVLGGSALMLAAVAVGVARLRGPDRVLVPIAVTMVLLSGVGVVATEVAFGPAAAGEARVLDGTDPLAAVTGATVSGVAVSGGPVSGGAVSGAAQSGRDLTVKIGKVVLSIDRFGDWQAALPVVLTNRSDRVRSVDVEFEAMSAKGKHLTYDSAFVPPLGPGQSVRVNVFTVVHQQLAPQLKKAKFRVVRAVWFG